MCTASHILFSFSLKVRPFVLSEERSVSSTKCLPEKVLRGVTTFTFLLRVKSLVSGCTVGRPLRRLGYCRCESPGSHRVIPHEADVLTRPRYSPESVKGLKRERLSSNPSVFTYHELLLHRPYLRLTCLVGPVKLTVFLPL